MTDGYNISQIVPINSDIYVIEEINIKDPEDDRFGYDYEAKKVYGMALVKADGIKGIYPIIDGDTLFDIYNGFSFAHTKAYLNKANEYAGKVFFVGELNERRYAKEENR